MWFSWTKSGISLLSRSLQATLEEDSPRQLAAAVAIGALVGLLPNGNLLGLALLAMVVGSRRFNTVMGLLSAGCFAIAGWCFQSFLHRVGNLVLNQPHLAKLWAALYDLPLVPWTSFNHTRVMGAIVVGLYLLFPVYVLAHALVENNRTEVVRQLKRRRWATWIWSADGATEGAGS